MYLYLAFERGIAYVMLWDLSPDNPHPRKRFTSHDLGTMPAIICGNSQPTTGSHSIRVYMKGGEAK